MAVSYTHLDVYKRQVPANVKVKISSVPIFGGASNKAQPPIVPDGPTVYVDCVSIFGGVDVK